MQPNTQKLPQGKEENIEILWQYTENLKQELEFRLDYLAGRIDTICDVIRKIEGGSV